MLMTWLTCIQYAGIGTNNSIVLYASQLLYNYSIINHKLQSIPSLILIVYYIIIYNILIFKYMATCR